MRGRALALVFLCVLGGGPVGCLSAQPDASGWVDPDPYERSNRLVFAFNEGLDKILLQPLGRAWRFITPRFVRTGLDNAFVNLKFPVRALSALGQGEPGHAGSETVRFLANSTIGVIGLWDPATRLFGMPFYDEDFGQMFAVWGIGSGPYWVLPFYGPSSPRGTTGQVFDAVFNLLPSYGVPIEIVNSRAIAVPAVDTARATSLDYYVFVRQAYLASRRAQIDDRGPTWRHPDAGPSDAAPADDDFYDDDAFYESDLTGEEDLDAAAPGGGADPDAPDEETP